ncbi:hypothetical protein CTAYLR_003553 [Chrysophaeum taylorii]|uniref:PDZ domain-containing protein n=1 Tax=Chrysophaeum taylorii TaxID=2483200 RepID=A0AAD7UMJ6_9STRA|nr:hypothetical protein CTAYLR_003553 [Chrysophaeum taylorii]
MSSHEDENKAEKKRYKRARWGARNLIHEAFEDGFPAMRDRFARERIAAEQKYEYNLGTRTFETVEAADDGMAWLRALFVELDNQCDKPDDDDEEEDAVPPDYARATLRECLQEELVHWRIQPSARVGRSNSNTISITLDNHQVPDARDTLSFNFDVEGPLGMDVKPCALGVTVVALHNGGLAEAKGIRTHDVITAINDLKGEDLAALPKAQAMAHFRCRPLRVVLARPKDHSNPRPRPFAPRHNLSINVGIRHPHIAGDQHEPDTPDSVATIERSAATIERPCSPATPTA